MVILFLDFYRFFSIAVSVFLTVGKFCFTPFDYIVLCFFWKNPVSLTYTILKTIKNKNKYYSQRIWKKTFHYIPCRDSRRMSYEPIKKWVFPCINHPQILMVCMYTGTNWEYRSKSYKFLVLTVITLLDIFFLLLIIYCTYFLICTYNF